MKKRPTIPFRLGSQVAQAGYHPTSPLMKQLTDLTRRGAPTQNACLGYLKEDEAVTRKFFQTYFEHLAHGVDYVYAHYHTEFNGFRFVDTGPIHMLHEGKTGKIFLVISREDIHHLAQCRLPDFQSPKTAPFFVTLPQLITLTGVEEAYHQHQFRTEPDKYLPHAQPLQDWSKPDPQYSENIIERDAEIVVRAAAHSMGYFKQAYAHSIASRF